VRVLRGLYGNLTALGAHLGCHDLLSLLLAVPAEIAAVERGRSFAKEVDKKFAKFPKAVRLARLDSAPASAGAGSDAQCALDPLQPDIARPTST